MRGANRATTIKRHQRESAERRALHKRIGKSQWSAALFFLATASAFTAILAAGLIALNRAHSGEGVEIVLYPQRARFVIFAVMPSLIAATRLSSRVYQRMIGAPPPFFSIEYMMASTEVDWPWLERAALGLALAIFAVGILNTRQYVALTPAGLVEQDAFKSAPTVYPKAEFDRAVKDRSLHLVFKDGRVWTPSSAGLELDTETEGLIITHFATLPSAS